MCGIGCIPEHDRSRAASAPWGVLTLPRPTWTLALAVGLFGVVAGCARPIGSIIPEGDAAAPGPDAGDLCADVVCETPPSTCTDAETLREYGPTRCVEGRCELAPIDTRCERGCVDGGCVCVPVAWTTSSVPGAALSGTASLAVEPDGTLHVAYMDAADAARYAWRAPGGGWSVDHLVDADGSGGDPTAIAVDGSGGVHLAYRGARLDPELRYARADATGGWAITTVERHGGDPALAIDSSGVVHLTYIYFSGWQLHYALRAPDGGWSIVELDTVYPRRWPSMTLDAAGEPHIACDDSGTLIYFRRDPGAGGFTALPVETIANSVSSIAIDAAGGTHLAYEHDEGASELSHALRGPTGEWAITRVHTGDDSGYVGHGAALTIDPAGGLHVSYTEVPEQILHYAYRPPGGTWEREPVDAATFSRTAIGRDAQGGVHVLYTADGGLLRYATMRRCP